MHASTLLADGISSMVLHLPGAGQKAVSDHLAASAQNLILSKLLTHLWAAGYTPQEPAP